MNRVFRNIFIALVFSLVITSCGSGSGSGSGSSDRKLRANLNGAIGLGVGTPGAEGGLIAQSSHTSLAETILAFIGIKPATAVPVKYLSQFLQISTEGIFSAILTRDFADPSEEDPDKTVSLSIDVIDFRYGKEFVFVHGIFDDVAIKTELSDPTVEPEVIDCRLIAIKLSDSEITCIQLGQGTLGDRLSSYTNNGSGNGFDIDIDQSGKDFVYYIYSDLGIIANRKSYLKTWSESAGATKIFVQDDVSCSPGQTLCQFRNIFAKNGYIFIENYTPLIGGDAQKIFGPLSGPYTTINSLTYTSVRNGDKVFYNTSYDDQGNQCVGCLDGGVRKGVFDLSNGIHTDLTNTNIGYCSWVNYASLYMPVQRKWVGQNAAFVLSGFNQNGDPNSRYQVTTDNSKAINALNLYRIDSDGTCTQLTSSHIFFEGVKFKDQVYIAGLDFSGNRVMYEIDLLTDGFSGVNLIDPSYFPPINMDDLWNQNHQTSPLMPHVSIYNQGIQVLANNSNLELQYGYYDVGNSNWTYSNQGEQSLAKVYFTDQQTLSTGF